MKKFSKHALKGAGIFKQNSLELLQETISGFFNIKQAFKGDINERKLIYRNLYEKALADYLL